jgi:hypothetical protein
MHPTDSSSSLISAAVDQVEIGESDASTTASEQNYPSTPQTTSAPVKWSDVTNGTVDQTAMPHVEWMAVAVPTECAPGGACDGLWKNGADERILIEKLDIMFESGVTWKMEMHSLTSISVEVNGETNHAELDMHGGRLLWDDDDVWTFYGQAGDTSPCTPQPVTELPCMMSPTGANTVPYTMMPFFPKSPTPAPQDSLMQPQYQCIPTTGSWNAPADNWEVCWDWSNKGWCKKGAQCKWYHPTAEGNTASQKKWTPASTAPCPW